MAITWEVKITVRDVVRKEVSIIATRTDGLDVTTFRIISAILNTTAQKNACIDQIWDMHQTHLAKQAQINNIVSGLETQAKANLEARE